MKISQEEIDAAIVAYNGNVLTVVGRKQLNGMKAALEAAYHVRKARKKAARAAKPSILDDDQQAAIRKIKQADSYGFPKCPNCDKYIVRYMGGEKNFADLGK